MEEQKQPKSEQKQSKSMQKEPGLAPGHAEVVKFQWSKPKEAAPEIYGNYVHVSWTLFDVRFLIGQLIPTGVDLSSGFVAEERAAVTVAWPEAKVLRDMLTEIVDRYEKINGEIKQLKLPPG
jgi:hypothetical protein